VWQDIGKDVWQDRKEQEERGCWYVEEKSAQESSKACFTIYHQHSIANGSHAIFNRLTLE